VGDLCKLLADEVGKDHAQRRTIRKWLILEPAIAERRLQCLTEDGQAWRPVAGGLGRADLRNGNHRPPALARFVGPKIDRLECESRERPLRAIAILGNG